MAGFSFDTPSAVTYTPICTAKAEQFPYRPDWAIVMEGAEGNGKPILYLVSETKGENWRTDLRPDERRRIECGAAHFGSKQLGKKRTLGEVDYKVVSGAGELP